MNSPRMTNRAASHRARTKWWSARHYPKTANIELVRLSFETPLVELITTKHWKESWVILLMRNGIYSVEGLHRALSAEYVPRFRYSSAQLMSELARMREELEAGEKAAEEARDEG